MEKIFDIAIVGGGASGMTAAIYAKRSGLDVIIFEKGVPGGVIASSFEVENYPGFSKIKGIDLATKMFGQVQALGVSFEFDEVSKVTVSGEIKVVKTASKTFFARTVLLAHGAMVRTLDIENEKRFIGKGVSFCATCDGNFFKDKIVALVGGGSTALEDAAYLSNIAKKVFLIHRREQFRGEEILVERIKKTPNVELVLNSVVTALIGSESLEKVEVTHRQTNEKRQLEVAGLFVCIGRGPDTDIIDGDIEKDKNGYIIADGKMRTNVEGVYAAGDIRNTSLRQIVTACSDGAIAATNILDYLKTKEKEK